MQLWRPAQSIKVKALGLVWKDGKLLANEVYRDDGTIKGVRPLGGHVEFGETWQQALVREFAEELEASVTVTGSPIVLENIYTHHRLVGHEIVFLAEVLFADTTILERDCIEFREDNGQKCLARWFQLDELDAGGVELFPNGLGTALLERSSLV